MKHLSICLLLHVLATSLSAQQFQLTVTNGYGGGTYAAGDTVHIWAAEWPLTKVFGSWTGAVNYLEDRDEWHTRLVMPAQNVTVTANTLTMPPNSTLEFAEIQGRDTLKPVFYYFPANPRGVVWFFHGTGGNVFSWATTYDNRQLVNSCIADTLAVVITECEESTRGVDLNNDGNFGRWHYDPDPIGNVDLANISAIRDTLEQRGLVAPEVPNIGAGFSAGGAMAQIMGWYDQWKVGLNYGTGGVSGAATASLSPTLFSPNRRDDHPEVGPISVSQTLTSQQLYLDRGVCSEVYINEPGPLHPQRFARKPGITLAESQAIFDDLQNNNCLTADHYLSVSDKQIQLMAQVSPQNWPSLAGMSVADINFIKDQLSVLWAGHHFTPDFNGKALRFIRDACSLTPALETPVATTAHLRISPNPATDRIVLEGYNGTIRVLDLTGQLRVQTTGPVVEVGQLSPGIYFVQTATGCGKFVRQ